MALLRRIFTFFLFGSALSALAVDLEPVTIRDFSTGLVTDRDSTLLPDGASQDLQNVDVEDGSIRKRPGSIKLNSTALGAGEAVRLLHAYTDQSVTFWLLAVSSNTIYKSNDGGNTFSVGTGGYGLSGTTRLQAVNGFGNAYFVSESTNALEFNGTAFSQNTSIPLGAAVAFFAERLWVAQNSIIYGSRVADDTDWVDDGVDDADAFSGTVRNNDGYSIRAMVPFGSDLFIFKDFSIDRLILNSDGLTFSLLPVTSNLGTSYPETVKVADNRIVWLGHDGVYAYNGSTLQRISENIQPTFEGLAQLSAAGRSYIETTQTQFAAGQSSGVTSGILEDSVVLSTWTDTDTTADDFAAGTLTNLSTSTYPGTIALEFTSADTTESFSSVNQIDNSVKTRVAYPVTYTSYTSISAFVSTAAASGVGPGLLVTVGSGTPQIKSIVYTSSSGAPAVEYYSSSFTACTGSSGVFVCVAPAISTSVPAGTWWVGVALNVTPTGMYNPIGSLSGGAGKKYNGSWSALANSYPYMNGYVRVSAQSVTGVATGTFVSQTFDTGLANSPQWLATTPTYATNGNTVSFFTQTSTDGASWEAREPWTPGSSPTSTASRYIRYHVDMSTGSAFTSAPFVSDVTLSARQTSGRYLSQPVSLSGITSWGVFGANHVLNSGNITYEIYTDTDTTMPLVAGSPTQFVSSQTVVIGGIPAVATAPYAVVGATFAITAATQEPQLDDFTLRWNEGDSTLYPAGLFWNQRYHISLAVGATDYNDEMFIYDQNSAWTRYTGLPASSLAVYRNQPYLGTPDGYVVRFNEAGRYRDYDDDAIAAYWVSKDNDFGYPITTKSLMRYYLTGNYAVGATLTFGYGVERGVLTEATYSQAQTGFWRKSVVPSSVSYSEGIQHRFKFSNSTIDSPMSVLSVTGQWRRNTNP